MTRKEKAARNVIIAERRLSNVSMGDIAKEFNLTLGAVCNICKALGLGGKRSNKKATYRKPTFTEEHLKAEEDRRRAMVERYEGFTYIGNYTGSDGTVDIRHEPCGSILTKSWVTIRHTRNNGLDCPVCRELKQKKTEEEKIRTEVKNEFVRRARIKQRQAVMRECGECGELFVSYRDTDRYCSKECLIKHNNRVGKDKRVKRIGERRVNKDIDWRLLYKVENGICYLCGEQVDTDDYEWRDGVFIAGDRYPSVDHVVALKDGGLHAWNNVRLAHRICNTRKG